MENLKIKIARVLLLIGLAIGLKSWWMTISHVGSPSYILVPEFSKGIYHAWYHAFREAIGDVASIVILVLVFFGNSSWRTPKTWWICLILMIGYYSPFWIGTPFLAELAAPHMTAELVHIGMAIFPAIGLFLAKDTFFKDS